MQKESVVVGESMNTQHIAEPEQLEADRKQIGLNWQLDMILKNINAGVSASCVDIDGTTHYIYANDKFYQIYGYTKEQFETELKGSTQELIVPAYYEKVQEKMQYAAEHMETVQFDYQAYKRNGSVAWIRVKVAVCHMDEQEQPVYVTIYNDISKEKKTAKRIRELNEKLSNCEIFVQLNIIEKRVEEFQSVYVTPKDSIRFIEDQNQYERYMKEVAYEEEYEIVYDALSYKGIIEMVI
ncbi:MAG: PAS domain-containing protein [bacterium]|nr:PAS domain-containing protein [bacterium]